MGLELFMHALPCWPLLKGVSQYEILTNGESMMDLLPNNPKQK